MKLSRDTYVVELSFKLKVPPMKSQFPMRQAYV